MPTPVAKNGFEKVSPSQKIARAGLRLGPRPEYWGPTCGSFFRRQDKLPSFSFQVETAAETRHETMKNSHFGDFFGPAGADPVSLVPFFASSCLR